MRAALRAARAGVQRRIAIARHRLDRADRRADLVADEAQRPHHAGPQPKRRHFERRPPHSRHMLAVRTSCQVGSTFPTPAASCQASNDRICPRLPGLDASHAR